MKVSIVGRPVSIPVKQETIDSFFTFILLELEFRTFTYTHCAPITLWLDLSQIPTSPRRRNVTAIQIYICIEKQSLESRCIWYFAKCKFCLLYHFETVHIAHFALA